MSGYQAIKSEMMQRIHKRTYAPGASIPNEIELAAEFKVARATVNRALRELSDEGVLERKRHSGTKVTALRTRHAKLEIPLIRLEIENSGATYEYRLIEREEVIAPEWLADRLSLANAQKFIHLTCLHLKSGEPFILEDRWINLEAVPLAAHADFNTSNPNEWLINLMPFTRAEFSFSAISLDAKAAKLLNAKQKSACFVAERVTWLGLSAVTYAQLTFATGYKMVSRI